MATALNLDNLLVGDSTFRDEKEREREINKVFSTFFPKPIKKGWFIFKRLQHQRLTREQITEILIKNHLVRENADSETATNEAINRNYDIDTWGRTYAFMEMINGGGHKIYEFQLREYEKRF